MMITITSLSRLGSLSLAIAAAMLVPILSADNAEAKRGGGHGQGPSFVSEDFVVGKGTRGYSGFIPGGAYCDYVRTPNRKCVVTPSGDERCRIVNYTLTQTCFR